MTEWKTYRLGDLCDTISDTYKGCANEVVLINTSDVLEGKCLNHTKEPNRNLKGQFKKTFKKYDILYSEIRPANKRFAYIDFDATNYIASTKLMVLRHNEKIEPLYLYYILQSQSIIDELQMLAESRSGTFPQITFAELSRLKVKLPNREMQRQILGILGAIDDKIENNRRINTNLELQAQALYKQWFVDNRKDDWEVGKVSDYYDITIGKTPPRKEKQWFSNNPKDSVWVSISDLGSCGAYISDSSEYLTAEAVKKFNIKVIPNNTVLLSFKLTVGRVAITDGVLTTNEAIAHFNTLNDYITEYTYLALKAYNFANLGSTSSIATAVNSKIIKAMPWVMPNDDVLRDFHNIVAPLFAQIKNNIRENETLATLRDTLLPKLMNGEIKM